MTAGSSMLAITSSFPPQRRHESIQAMQRSAPSDGKDPHQRLGPCHRDMFKDRPLGAGVT